MAGALKLVGQGKWLPEDMKAALEAATGGLARRLRLRTG